METINPKEWLAKQLNVDEIELTYLSFKGQTVADLLSAFQSDIICNNKC